MMIGHNVNQVEFARLVTAGLLETEAILINLVGMDRLNEFDLSTIKAVFDQAAGWNQYAQCLMGNLCTRGGYHSLAEMWFTLAALGA